MRLRAGTGRHRLGRAELPLKLGPDGDETHSGAIVPAMHWTRSCLWLLGALALGCQSEPAPVESAPPAAAASSGVSRHGAPVGSGAAIKLTTVLAAPNTYEGKQVVVEGHVRRACSRKGCWMEVAAGPDKKLQGCRVTFKDYGFFVPLDAAGSTARLKGVVHTKTVKASHVKHLEEEGATFAAKLPDGSAKEVRIEAVGVELTRPGA